MKEYKISEELRNGIVKYLASKPWAEANDGIVALQQIEEIKEKEKDAGSGKTK